MMTCLLNCGSLVANIAREVTAKKDIPCKHVQEAGGQVAGSGMLALFIHLFSVLGNLNT